MVWDELNKQIKGVRSDVRALHTDTEQAGYSDGVPAYTVANLPITGLANGQSFVTIAFASNGRKAGEGAGAGTGVMVYWDNPSGLWLKFSSDTVVTA